VTDEGAAFVTGGTSGIGLAVARALAERGLPVAICGRDADKLGRAEAELAAIAGPDRVIATQADVSKAADVERWVREAAAGLGAPSVLVLNAGIGHYEELVATSEEAWDETLDVNLKGPFLVARAALPLMRERGAGYVIAVSSLSGKQGMPRLSAYCASKFGLVGLTESLLREEAGHRIRATAICPGMVATSMPTESTIPREQMIRPEDIARTVVWLLDLSPQVVVREVVVERTGVM
jgi:NAD(P)-dependent dehydrogenase (short-subunit alcohol dehydrogenase family)